MAWRAELRSNYRGLRLGDGPVVCSDLSILVGPNNGGKSQYLRSLILIDAARQVLLSWGIAAAPFIFDITHKTRISISQVLMDTGFRELADELAEVMVAGKKIVLTWRAPVADYESLDVVANEGRAQIRHTGQKLETPKRPKGNRNILLEITLALDRSANDIVIHRCEVSDLWEGYKLVVSPRRRPGRPSKLGDPSERIADTMSAQWFQGSTEIDVDTIRSRWRDVKTTERFPVDFESGLALSHVYRVIFNALPEVTFIGPIRLVDDRQYHVDAGTLVGVGPRGELTWVQLKELERLPKRYRDWFSEHVKSVLDLRDIKSKRDSPTRPKVTARLGRKDIGLHSFGLGTSQSIPILVQMAVTLGKMKSRKLPEWLGETAPPAMLIMEEPESHLHPRAQRALARAIVEFCARGGRVLIETHSEIILRSVESEIAKKTIGADSAIVNWVDSRTRKRATNPVMTLAFEKAGGLQGDLPPSFDQIVPELIEERVLRG